MPNPETRIATQLFSGTLYESQKQTPEQLAQAIEFAFEVADGILSRERRGRGCPKLENSPPMSELGPRLSSTKERVIEREPLAPLDTLLANRRGRAIEAAEKPGRKGPTIH